MELDKKKIRYNCPKCGSSLSNPISEIGETDQCPKCQQPFIVPGADLLAKRQSDEAESRESKRAQAEPEINAATERVRQEQVAYKAEADERDERNARKEARASRQAVGDGDRMYEILRVAEVAIGVGYWMVWIGAVCQIFAGLVAALKMESWPILIGVVSATIAEVLLVLCFLGITAGVLQIEKNTRRTGEPRQ